MKLWQKVTIGLFAGIICGVVLHKLPESDDYTNALKPVGELFINLIKMVVSPLIFLSLVSGVTSVSDPKVLGRIGIKSTFAFLLTTTLAITIGLTVALILQPGSSVDLDFGTTTDQTVKENFDILKLFLDIIPANGFGAIVGVPVKGAINAVSGSETLQVVFFAIFTGLTLNKMDKDKRRLTEFFNLMSKLVFKMISLIMECSPYGAFALTAWVVGTQGFEIIFSLLKLVICVILAMGVQYLVFGVLIKVFAGLSPMPFYKKSLEYQSLAFATSSSKAALPTTMDICRDKMGISHTSTSFILPLGASINMDGMAIYLGMCAIFFAQALDITLTTYDYAMIIITSTLGSIGAAGIPGGSMIMLPMVLSTVHIPIEGVALIAGIDRLLDMLRTTINITGDSTITLIIDKSEGTLDLEKYYS